jgi:hypothetical protein
VLRHVLPNSQHPRDRPVSRWVTGLQNRTDHIPNLYSKEREKLILLTSKKMMVNLGYEKDIGMGLYLVLVL